jgi:glycosyltransferase involved in cell wall biosynthesis
MFTIHSKVSDKSKGNILFCRSNPISPDPRVEKEARAAARAGYSISITGWDRSAELPRHELNSEFIIYRLHIQSNYGKGLMNLPGLLRWQLGLLWWMIRNIKEIDLIHACDFDTIMPALICKFVWGKKVVYDIFDFYADHLRATPELIKKVIRYVDLSVINSVDAVILPDKSRQRQIVGSHPKNLVFIYNTPEDLYKNSILGRYENNNSHMRIAYIGLLQRERGLFELLEVLRSHPEWYLDLAGFGGDQDEILSNLSSIPNVKWHGRVNYVDALKISSKADVLFATYDPAIPNHRYSSPNKVFEAMMLGKPIIVAKDTNMDKIISQQECGIVIEYGNTHELEAGLDTLSDDQELRRLLGQNGRKAYEREFAWSRMENRLISLYNDLLKP